jgi:hypothetical protein
MERGGRKAGRQAARALKRSILWRETFSFIDRSARMDSTKPLPLLWGLAFAAEAIAATLEAVEGHYLKAAALYCLALAFLLLAAGGATGQSRWRKLALYSLVLVSLGLLAYRLLTRAGA